MTPEGENDSCYFFNSIARNHILAILSKYLVQLRLNVLSTKKKFIYETNSIN